MHKLISAFLLALVILVVYKFIAFKSDKYQDALARFDELNSMIDLQQAELIRADNALQLQKTALDKCSGDLKTCAGKSSEQEVEITALKAIISDRVDQLTQVAHVVNGYRGYVDELKSRASANSQPNMDVLNADLLILINKLANQRSHIGALHDIIDEQHRKIVRLQRQFEIPNPPEPSSALYECNNTSCALYS